jgi:hypothetical protein
MTRPFEGGSMSLGRGGVPLQGEVGPGFIIVVDVGLQESAQVVLAEDDRVVQAFPPNRADHALRTGVLPG